MATITNSHIHSKSTIEVTRTFSVDADYGNGVDHYRLQIHTFKSKVKNSCGDGDMQAVPMQYDDLLALRDFLNEQFPDKNLIRKDGTDKTNDLAISMRSENEEQD